MGVGDYSLYVVPAPAHCLYQPDAATAARLLAALVDLAWVDAEAACEFVAVGCGDRPRNSAVPFLAVGSALHDALAQARAVLVAPQTHPQEWHWPDGAIAANGRSRMYDFEATSRMEARYCERLSLVWTRDVSAVSGETAARLPCLSCGIHLLSAAEDLLEFKVLPACCPACGGTIRAETLVGGVHDVVTGEVRRVEAPVFRFALRLTAVSEALPEREPVLLDARLAATLSGLTGVGWRPVASLG